MLHSGSEARQGPWLTSGLYTIGSLLLVQPSGPGHGESFKEHGGRAGCLYSGSSVGEHLYSELPASHGAHAVISSASLPQLPLPAPCRFSVSWLQ